MTTKTTAKATKELTPELTVIEHAAREYNEEALELDAKVDAFKAGLQTLVADHLPAIRRQVGVVARREAELQALVEQHPEQFEKPATLVLHGVKVGYSTSVGALAFDSEETVIKLIETRLAARADELVRTEKSLNKDAVKRLDAKDQKLIGCWIDGAGRAPFIKRSAGEIDKMIDRMRTALVEGMLKSVGEHGNN